jgi:hypothetical protein
VFATSSRLLSAAFLARARAMVSAAVPCSVMRFRAARATSLSVAMWDYGAHGERFANEKNPPRHPWQARKGELRGNVKNDEPALLEPAAA